MKGNEKVLEKVSELQESTKENSNLIVQTFYKVEENNRKVNEILETLKEENEERTIAAKEKDDREDREKRRKDEEEKLIREEQTSSLLDIKETIIHEHKITNQNIMQSGKETIEELQEAMNEMLKRIDQGINRSKDEIGEKIEDLRRIEGEHITESSEEKNKINETLDWIGMNIGKLIDCFRNMEAEIKTESDSNKFKECLENMARTMDNTIDLVKGNDNILEQDIMKGVNEIERNVNEYINEARIVLEGNMKRNMELEIGNLYKSRRNDEGK
jgi:hypothetical protein